MKRMVLAPIIGGSGGTFNPYVNLHRRMGKREEKKNKGKGGTATNARSSLVGENPRKDDSVTFCCLANPRGGKGKKEEARFDIWIAWRIKEGTEWDR